MKAATVFALLLALVAGCTAYPKHGGFPEYSMGGSGVTETPYQVCYGPPEVKVQKAYLFMGIVLIRYYGTEVDKGCQTWVHVHSETPNVEVHRSFP